MKKICQNIIEADTILRRFCRSKQQIQVWVPKSIENNVLKIVSELEDAGAKFEKLTIHTYKRGVML